MVTMEEIITGLPVVEDITSRIRRHYSPHAMARSNPKYRKVAKRILRNGESEQSTVKHPTCTNCNGTGMLHIPSNPCRSGRSNVLKSENKVWTSCHGCEGTGHITPEMQKKYYDSWQLGEDAPFKSPPTAGDPQVHTSDDIGAEFLSKLAHAKEPEQAEILSVLFGENWEDPHTAEEIAAAYVGIDSINRKEIDTILHEPHTAIDDALQPHNVQH